MTTADISETQALVYECMPKNYKDCTVKLLFQTAMRTLTTPFFTLTLKRKYGYLDIYVHNHRLT